MDHVFFFAISDKFAIKKELPKIDTAKRAKIMHDFRLHPSW